MFSLAIERVKRTQLLYALMHRGSERAVLQTYSNRVDLKASEPEVAMILPVPASAHNVMLLNREGDTTVTEAFDGLVRLFKQEETSLFGGMRGGGMEGFGALAVVQSGSYHVSIVPTLQDIARLDQGVFASIHRDEVLMRGLAETDAKRQGGFSYLVFVLRATADYQPFAYMYMLQPTDQAGFIPTMHHHPRVFVGGPERLRIVAPWADDWDHDVVILGVPAVSMFFKTTALRQYCGSVTRLLEERLLQPSVGAGWSIPDVAFRVELQGRHRNFNMAFSVMGSLYPHEGTGCDACGTWLKTGHRYKCTVCPDLDLCQDCNRAGRETHNLQHTRGPHPMIELKSAAETEAYRASLVAMRQTERLLDTVRSIQQACAQVLV